MNAVDNTRAPTAFESYNARSLPAAEIAKSFIPPPAFEALTRRTHAVLVGPRGSGKTTLLKMLQSEALEAWRHAEAGRFRQQIDFTGVFIPADVSWSEQIAALVDSSESYPLSRTISQAAFTTHVLRSLVAAMQYRAHPPTAADLAAHRRLSVDRWHEAEFCISVAESWFLEPSTPSLAALGQSLSARLSEVARVARQETARGLSGVEERLADVPWLHLAVLPSVILAIDRFNAMAHEPGARWALLLDELELAPSAIVRQLLNALRSTDERLLFKLAYSPFGTDLQVLERDAAAAPTQDYTPIPLYYANKDDGIRFTQTLISKIMEDRGLTDVSLEQFFGRSVLDYDPSDTKQVSVGRRRQVERMYQDLAASDDSFRRYLLKRNVDPEGLSDVRGTPRAAVIRKVVGLVPIRLTYRHSQTEETGPTGRRLRSRKNPPIYSGTPAFLAMLDGNPRWTIGVMSRLLDTYELKGKRVDASTQSAEMASASNRFLALLKTIATSPNSSSYDGQLAHAVQTARVPSIYRLIEAIGTYFSGQIVGKDFDPDPYGTFRVDPGVSEPVALMLGRALNAGAIVLVNQSGSSPMISSVRGHRFRLSYLLSAHYHLPLRLDREVSLSFILEGHVGKTRQPPRRPRPVDQQPVLPDLFEEQPGE